MNDLKKLIREIPDYPKPGILFYDLTTLLKDKKGFHELVDRLCAHYDGKKVDVVAGIEARGFIFAPALAYRLGAGFVPVRKPKKLPCKTTTVTYQLEYGTDQLEIHADAVQPGQSVSALRRFARNRRHRCGCDPTGAAIGRRSRRRGVRSRVEFPARPPEITGRGRVFAAEIRFLDLFPAE